MKPVNVIAVVVVISGKSEGKLTEDVFIDSWKFSSTFPQSKYAISLEIGKRLLCVEIYLTNGH